MNEDPDSTGLQVAVRIEDPTWLAAIPDVEALCHRAALAAVRPATGQDADAAFPQGAEVALVLGDDALLRRLNRDFRGLDRPTNVLSFSLDEPDSRPAPDQSRLLGDVVLARETVLREAGEQDKTAADHLQHLVVHGLLHLLGFDHEAEEEATRMEAVETGILARLGVADPYREREAAQPGTAGGPTP